MKIKLTSILVLCGLFPSILSAQAFGIEEGTSISSLEIIQDIGDDLYTVSVPSPVSGFETYAVLATEEAGACQVRALGENYERDGYGSDVRGRFQELKTLLDQKYGDGEFLDRLRPGALWDESDEWVMSLRQNERFYVAEWGVNEEGGLDNIIMSVRALSSNTSYIILQYTFSNYEDCELKALEEDASGL